MKLKPEEAGLFYEMFLPLLDYVNENYHVTMETVHFTGERVDPGEAARWHNFYGNAPGLLMTTLPELYCLKNSVRSF